MCANSEVQVILRMLELEVEDADTVFNMLDTNAVGEITFEDFLRGVMRLKGQARSMDMVAMQITTDAMHHALDDVHARVYKMEKMLASVLTTLSEQFDLAYEPIATAQTNAFTIDDIGSGSSSRFGESCELSTNGVSIRGVARSPDFA